MNNANVYEDIDAVVNRTNKLDKRLSDRITKLEQRITDLEQALETLRQRYDAHEYYGG